MRILVVGAGGVLGSAVVKALEPDHEVVPASRSGQFTVDIRDPASITKLYDSVGPVDAVMCTAGKTPFAPFGELGLDDYRRGIDDKLLGQIELVRQGTGLLREGGGFTLVSGILTAEPIAAGTVASTVNGGVEAFVRAAATRLPRGLRINAVSPAALVESWDGYQGFFPGHRPVPAADAALAYVRSLAEGRTGHVYAVGHQ